MDLEVPFISHLSRGDDEPVTQQEQQRPSYRHRCIRRRRSSSNAASISTSSAAPSNSDDARHSHELMTFLGIEETQPDRGSSNTTPKDDDDDDDDDDHKEDISNLEMLNAGDLRGKNAQFLDRRKGILYIGDRRFESRSLRLFSVTHPLRRRCIQLITQPYFNPVVLGIVFLSSIFLVLQDPDEHNYFQDGQAQSEDRGAKSSTSFNITALTNQSVILAVDIVFFVIFFVEMLIKIIAEGFVLHRHSYLRSAWNVLDFLIIVVSLIDILQVDLGSNVFTLLRVLRPLRTISRVEGMRQLVQTLVSCLPIMGPVLVLYGLALSMFASTGLVLWRNTFHSRCRNELGQYDGFCGTNSLIVSFRTYCPAGTTPATNYTCIEGAPPPNDVRNFDNFLNAFFSVFQSITLDSWAEIAYWTMDGWSPFAAIYWIALTLLGAYFLMNLVLAVVTDSFSRFYTEQQMDRLNTDVESFASLRTPSGDVMMLSPRERRRAVDSANDAHSSNNNINDSNPLSEAEPSQRRRRKSSRRRRSETERRRTTPSTDPDWLGVRSQRSNSIRGISRFQRRESLRHIPMENRTRGASPLAHLSWDGFIRSTSDAARTSLINLDQPSQSQRERSSFVLNDGFTPNSGSFDDLVPKTQPDPFIRNEEGDADVSATIPVFQYTVEAPTPRSDDAASRTNSPSPDNNTFVDLSENEFVESDGASTSSSALLSSPSSADSKNSCGDEDGTNTEKNDRRRRASLLEGQPAVVQDTNLPEETLMVRVRRLVESVRFGQVMLGVLVLNIAFMSMEHEGMPDGLGSAIEIANIVFVVIFSIELVLKIIVLKIEYFKDRYDIIDFFVVIISIIELGTINTSQLNLLRLLRLFRILRIFKLTRTWKVLQQVMHTIQSALKYLGHLGLLALLFISLMAIFGRHLIAGGGTRAAFCQDFHNESACEAITNCAWLGDNNNYVKGPNPLDGHHSCRQYQKYNTIDAASRMQFHSLYEAFVTVFTLITRDQWGNIALRFMREFSPWSVLYFSFVVVFGGYLLVNLFVSILLVNLGAEDREVSMTSRDVHKDEERAQQREQKKLKHSNKKHKKRTKVVDDDHENEPESPRAQLTRSRETLRNSQLYGAGFNPSASMSRNEAIFEIMRSNRDEDDGVIVEGEDDNIIIDSQQQQQQQQQQQVSSSSPSALPLLTQSVLPTDASDLHEDSTMNNKNKQNAKKKSKKKKKKKKTQSYLDCSSSSSDIEDTESNKQQPAVTFAPELVTEQSLPPDPSPLPAKRSKVKRKRGFSTKSTFGKKIEEFEELEGKSFFLFEPTHPVRFFCANIVYGTYFPFEMLISWLIISNCVLMILENKKIVGDYLSALHTLEVIYSVVFAIELFIRCIVHCAVLGPYSYIQRRRLNTLDAIIILTSLISAPFLFTSSTTAQRRNVIQIARVTMSLRPLRVLLRVKRIKIIILACWNTGRAVLHVLGVAAVLYFVFGIIGLQLFRGLLQSCNDGSDRSRDECTGQFFAGVQNYSVFVPPGLSSRSLDREWGNQGHYSFDNIFQSMLTLFEISALNGWVLILLRLGDVPTISGGRPSRNNLMWSHAYTILWVFFGNFFLVNIFVGVIVDHFTRLTLTYDGSIFLTEDQNEVIRIKKLLHKAKALQIRAPPPRRDAFIHWRLNTMCFKIVRHPAFIVLTFLVDFLNIFAILSIHVNSGDGWTTFQEVANMLVTVFFTIELGIQIGVAGFQSFWSFGWFRFDSFVVVASWFEFIVSTALTQNNQSTVVNLLRLLRIVRFAKYSPGLHRILDTINGCLPAFINIGCLVFMLFYMFSLIGVGLFGDVRQLDGVSGFLNSRANFSTFFWAMLTLYRVSTMDSWKDIQLGCSLQEPFCNADSDVAPLDCGMPWLATLYFTVFQVLTTYVMLNLFIAVILENFRESVLLPEYVREKMEDIAIFREAWSRYDPDAVQHISAEYFVPLLRQLPGRRARALLRGDDPDENPCEYALGLGGEPQSSIMPSLLQLGIPITFPDQNVLFADAIDAIGEKIFHIRLVDSATAAKHLQLRQNTKLYKFNYTVAHYYAARVIQVVWRAHHDGTLGYAVMQCDGGDVRLPTKTQQLDLVTPDSPLSLSVEDARHRRRHTRSGLTMENGRLFVNDGDASVLPRGRGASAAHMTTLMLSHSGTSKWNELLRPLLQLVRAANRSGVYGDDAVTEEEATRRRKEMRKKPVSSGGGGTAAGGVDLNPSTLGTLGSVAPGELLDSINLDVSVVASAPSHAITSPKRIRFVDVMRDRMEAVSSDSGDEVEMAEPIPEPPKAPVQEGPVQGPQFPTLQEFMSMTVNRSFSDAQRDGDDWRTALNYNRPTVAQIVRFKKLRDSYYDSVEGAYLPPPCEDVLLGLENNDDDDDYERRYREFEREEMFEASKTGLSINRDLPTIDELVAARRCLPATSVPLSDIIPMWRAGVRYSDSSANPSSRSILKPQSKLFDLEKEKECGEVPQPPPSRLANYFRDLIEDVKLRAKSEK